MTEWKIPLNGRDGVKGYTLVSEEDYEELSQYRWCTLRNGYVIRGATYAKGKKHHVFMHRQILGLPARYERSDDWRAASAVQGDHINRNPWDNRRENLRVITKSGNSRNVPGNRETTSQYRGVHWDTTKQRWCAVVTTKGKRHHCGYFKDEDAAGEAAAEGRLRLMAEAVD